MQLLLLGVIGELLRANRVLSERTLHRVRKVELQLGIAPDSLEDEEENDRVGMPPTQRPRAPA